MAIRVITEPNSGKYLPSSTDKDRPQAKGFAGNFPGWSARPPEDMFAFGTFDTVRPSCAYPGAPGGITSRWPGQQCVARLREPAAALQSMVPALASSTTAVASAAALGPLALGL